MNLVQYNIRCTERMRSVAVALWREATTETHKIKANGKIYERLQQQWYHYCAHLSSDLESYEWAMLRIASASANVTTSGQAKRSLAFMISLTVSRGFALRCALIIMQYMDIIYDIDYIIVVSRDGTADSAGGKRAAHTSRHKHITSPMI